MKRNKEKASFSIYLQWFVFLAVPAAEKRINLAENGSWAAQAPSDG